MFLAVISVIFKNLLLKDDYRYVWAVSFRWRKFAWKVREICSIWEVVTHS